MFDRRLVQNFDWVLLLLLLILTLTSLINLFSATYPIRDWGGSEVFQRQIYWFAMGFGIMLVLTLFNYSHLERLAYPTYGLMLILLIAVLLFGKVVCGSQRWLSLGPLTLQPSELAKMAVILVLAKFYSTNNHAGSYRLRALWRPLLLVAVPCVLILREPDLGTALLLLAVGFSIILFGKVHWRSLLLLVAAALLVAPFVWNHLEDYQQRRVLTFLQPEKDPLGSGYHINQSKISIGSGLFTGKGYLKGSQTQLHFLPEQHTDFIFSVLAEEWGFLGASGVLLVYLVLILWGVRIAQNSRDRFGSVMAIGIVAMIFWQVIINVGMATGLLPVVGIPLPLFSYGGSSLLSTLAGMGLLLSISMRRFMFQSA